MFIMAVKEPKVVSLDNHLRFWAIISMCIMAVKEPKVVSLDNHLVMCIMAVQMSQGPMWCLSLNGHEREDGLPSCTCSLSRGKYFSTFAIYTPLHHFC